MTHYHTNYASTPPPGGFSVGVVPGLNSDVHLQVANYFPGGEGGRCGAFAIVDFSVAELERRGGCGVDTDYGVDTVRRIWYDDGLADLLAQNGSTKAREVLGLLKGKDLLFEPAEGGGRGRVAFMVYEGYNM